MSRAASCALNPRRETKKPVQLALKRVLVHALAVFITPPQADPQIGAATRYQGGGRMSTSYNANPRHVSSQSHRAHRTANAATTGEAVYAIRGVKQLPAHLLTESPRRRTRTPGCRDDRNQLQGARIRFLTAVHAVITGSSFRRVRCLPARCAKVRPVDQRARHTVRAKLALLDRFVFLIPMRSCDARLQLRTCRQ